MIIVIFSAIAQEPHDAANLLLESPGLTVLFGPRSREVAYKYFFLTAACIHIFSSFLYLMVRRAQHSDPEWIARKALAVAKREQTTAGTGSGCIPPPP